MSFQSILQREGWRPQTLFTKILCQNCLSRNMPYRPVTTRVNLLDHFRNELYHPEKYTTHLKIESPIAETTITRRVARKRLLKSYCRLKTQEPQSLAELTREDIDQFLMRFTVHTDYLVAKRPMVEAFYILKELKEGKFIHVPFGVQEAEQMICLAAELKYFDKAVDLLKEYALEKKLLLSMQTYDAVLQLLSEKKNIAELEFWLGHIANTPHLSLTEDTIRSVTLCYLGHGQLESAAMYVKKNHTGLKLTQLVADYGQNDVELIERVLNYFASQALSNRKLHLTRKIYMQKTELGISSFKLLKQLISRCIHKGELRTGEIVLDGAISLNDLRGAQLCSDYLINAYLSEKNIKQSLTIWEKMVEGGMELEQSTLDGLLIHCAKLKYHTDVLRLYRRYQEIYPNMTMEAQVYAVRCLVMTKELTTAKILSKNLVESMPNMNKSLAKLTARTLFSLSAKSGDIGLFERTFNQVEGLDLDLRHKGLTSLVSCYLKRNNVLAAKMAFKNMAKHTDGPDVVDFNILMRTVVLEDKTMNHEKILEILKHMALVNITPNHTTMRTMLSYYEQGSSMLPQIYKKLLEMPLRGSDQVFLNNIAISKLLTKYNIEDIAGRFFYNDRGLILPNQRGKPIERDGITYKILLVASLENKKYISITEKLLKDMLARGIKPTRKLYESFINRLCEQGRINKAKRYIEEMEKNIGERPNQKTYTKLVDGLYNINRPELAMEVIKTNIGQEAMDRQVRRRLEGRPKHK